MVVELPIVARQAGRASIGGFKMTVLSVLLKPLSFQLTEARAH
jgi:hypothetical protein